MFHAFALLLFGRHGTIAIYVMSWRECRGDLMTLNLYFNTGSSLQTLIYNESRVYSDPETESNSSKVPVGLKGSEKEHNRKDTDARDQCPPSVFL